VLRFVLFQAAKYDISDREMAIELLQLGGSLLWRSLFAGRKAELTRIFCAVGITSPTAEAIAAVYNSERTSIRKRLESRSFKVTGDAISCPVQPHLSPVFGENRF
jgi:hypothetical protein